MQEYLGFGPGAHSDFGGRRFAYARDLNAYIKGEEHLSESACPAEREREEERVMLALRTARGARPVGAQGGHAGRRGSARRVRAPRPFPKKRPLAADAAGLSSVKRRHRAGARGAFSKFCEKVETFPRFRVFTYGGVSAILCYVYQFKAFSARRQIVKSIIRKFCRCRWQSCWRRLRSTPSRLTRSATI